MNKNQKGFALLEGLLIVLILTIIAFGGYYIWNTQKNTDKSSKDAVSASQSTPSTSSTKYFTIKEWGVRAPYDGPLTLKHEVQDNSTYVSSTQLIGATDTGCSRYGGLISRIPSDGNYFGTPIAQAVDQSSLKHASIGGYYYIFIHDQGLCPSISDSSSVAADLQSKNNDAVEALVPTLQAIPK